MNKEFSNEDHSLLMIDPAQQTCSVGATTILSLDKTDMSDVLNRALLALVRNREFAFVVDGLELNSAQSVFSMLVEKINEAAGTIGLAVKCHLETVDGTCRLRCSLPWTRHAIRSANMRLAA